MGDNWKQGIQKNFRKLKREIANPEAVVDELYKDGIITEEMQADILQYENEPEKMAGRMLEILLRRGHKALPALFNAFDESENEPLAKLLEPYVLQQKADLIKNENRFEPSVWPPEVKEKEKMRKDDVILSDIGLFKSQYNNHKENYPMDNEVRGSVLIINNIEFSVPEGGPKLLYRDGSDEDEIDVTQLFEQLHFNVHPYLNLTAQEMLNVAQEESSKIAKTDNCFICIIMSHGCTEGIYGVDGNVIAVDKIKEQFDSKHCMALDGKPKIFLIQACRGKAVEIKGKKDLDSKPEKESSGQQESMGSLSQKESIAVQATDGSNKTDVSEVTEQIDKMNVADSTPSSAPEIEGVPKFHSAADFLIAYATPLGYGAWRHKERGSWFLQAVVWIFKYHAHYEKITDMLTRVNRLVASGIARDIAGNAKVTVSDYSSSQIKNLYFFPGMVGKKYPVRPRE